MFQLHFKYQYYAEFYCSLDGLGVEKYYPKAYLGAEHMKQIKAE